MIGFKKSGAITFSSQLVVFVIGFANSVILARVMGPADRGSYALILLIPSIIGILFSLGIDIANIHYSAKRTYQISDIVSNSLMSSLGIGLIVILLFGGVINTSIFQKFLTANNITPFYVWLVIVTIPLMLLTNYFTRILLGREEMIQFNAVNILQTMFQFGLLIILLIIFRLGLFGAIVAHIVTTFVIGLLVILLIRKIGKIRLSLNKKLFKDSLCYGGKAYLGNIAQFLNYRLDMFLVAYFMDVKAVGYYAIATGLSERLWMLPGSVGTVLFPRISSGRDGQAVQLTPLVTRHTILIVSLASLILIIISRPFIQYFYGNDFLPAIKPLLILLFGIVALSIAKVLTSDLAGRGRPEYGAFAAFVSLGVNVPLNLLLIPKWGLAGAAFASTIAYILASIVVLVAYVRISKISYNRILLIKRQDLKMYANILLILNEKVMLYIKKHFHI